MRKLLLTLCMVTALLCQVSLAQNPQEGKPVQDAAFILKNYDNFFSYVSRYMHLSQDIVTCNAVSKPISKADFLKVLTTGYYLPVRLNSTDSKPHFNLYKMSAAQAKEMGQYIKGWSAVLYEHYRQERKPFPAFDLTDINGKRYTSAALKDKILVINCWFIGCSNCEKEMPELNKLKAAYRNRTDVVFLAISPDSKVAVQAFLKRKPFQYNQVAGQRAYLNSTLHVAGYPTHFVVNRQGTIVAVVDTPDEVRYALKNRI